MDLRDGQLQRSLTVRRASRAIACLERRHDRFGKWMAPAEVPVTMIAILAELGRFYFPWISRAADHAGKLLSYENPPRPSSNRSFGPPWEKESEWEI